MPIAGRVAFMPEKLRFCTIILLLSTRKWQVRISCTTSNPSHKRPSENYTQAFQMTALLDKA